MEDDWDLFAVVRSCSSTTTTATAASVDGSFSGKGYSNFEQGYSFSSTMFQDLFEPRSIEGLHGLFTPFSPKSEESSQLGQNLPISPLSVLGGLQDLPSEQQQQQVIKQIPLQKPQLFSVSGSKPSPRSKKRKNHMKKVCHVPAESLSSDTWSWRKYGQKPIKGSPYPRGYYRCSTSKGCMARKQVERNRSDPGMFIITYTGEHSHPMPTHRNSLAGSTRPKPAETPASKSPAPEKLESSREDLEDDDDDDEMALDDDFFAGLEDLTGECLSDHIPADLEFPWLAKSATAVATTAAGGGG